MSIEDLFEINQPRALEDEELEDILKILLSCLIRNCKKLLLISSEFDPIVKWKSKITKGIEEYLKCYKEEALEKSKVVKQTKVTSFFTIVEQNAEIPGPSGQKFSKPPLKELD